ncbi:hypothetical protein LPJ64_004313 [Coemansia asiatica]|uniref:NADP-dependent oxidoreductase domain-containing protein n=1 Tax=Coemansia asiatica TaxID=1052880 RepID=A0A9W8CJ78_9FUNG|nr:hypothetical protein LPJ64_004313 [Coemansia asiatica]
MLSNGLLMPSVGLGTWQQRDPETVQRVVAQAVDMGYRLIDTASAYRNEQSIGRALAQKFNDSRSNLSRKDIWITSKLAPKQHGYDQAIAAVNESLTNLQTDYIDLYLIHWPGVSGRAPEYPGHRKYRESSWKALEDLYRSGKVRAIGVSNYTKRHLQEMSEYAKILPMINQCELHPLFPQPDLLQYCKDNNILFTAYASLGEGALISDHAILPELQDVSNARSDLTRAQILLLWGLQHGAAVIPKASIVARLQENLDILSKKPLSDIELDMLASIPAERQRHFCWHAESVS